MRRRPATSRIWLLTTRSDSTGPVPRLRVAVVHDDVRDLARVADAREERHVPLAAALEHDDPLLVGLDAERLEEEREGELLRAALDEERGAREEELGAVAVELRQRAERLRLRERLRLVHRRPEIVRVADERELLEPVDAEEHRRVRRVEDLVAALREPAQHAIEMPLRVRAQVELRLLDEQDEAAQAGREDPLHPAHEQRGRRRRPTSGGPAAAGARARRRRPLPIPSRARRACASGGSPAGRARAARPRG